MRVYLRHLVAALALISDPEARIDVAQALAEGLTDDSVKGLHPSATLEGFDPERFTASVEQAAARRNLYGRLVIDADHITATLADVYRAQSIGPANMDAIQTALDRGRALMVRLERILAGPGDLDVTIDESEDDWSSATVGPDLGAEKDRIGDDN
jgi:hypothetical protein